VSKKANSTVAIPTARRAQVHWEGDAREVLQEWPKEIRVDFGNSLNEMQEGRPASLAVRPMPSIAAGVFELKTGDDAKWYRMVYLARIADVIYVLDCFEKNTRKTEKKDLARCLDRYKRVQQRLMEERNDAKRKQ
jgi:phage-related protein